MNNEEKRADALRAREDHIGRALKESERSGELKAAPSYGKPLDFGDGYDDTPAELRMPMKILTKPLNSFPMAISCNKGA